MYQNNKSAIKTNERARHLCTGDSKHIFIRSFFVSDRVNKDEFSIEYCNTLAMLANYFTKLLQGTLFCCLRKVIVIWTHVYTLQNYSPPPKKDCVEHPVSGDKPRIPQKTTNARS